jgi:hypothetical protein
MVAASAVVCGVRLETHRGSVSLHHKTSGYAMTLLQRFDHIGSARFLVFVSLLFLPFTSAGQESGINTSGASNCTAPDFDTNLESANAPDNYPNRRQ